VTDHALLSAVVCRRADLTGQLKTIAARIIEEHGLNQGDRALARNMAKRVDMALRYQRTNGMVRETEGQGPASCGRLLVGCLQAPLFIITH
jgi:hypothetical protein